MPRSPEMGGAPPEQERVKMKPDTYKVYLTFTTKDGAQKNEKLAVIDFTRWSRPKPLRAVANEIAGEIERFAPELNLKRSLTGMTDQMCFNDASPDTGRFYPSQEAILSLTGNDGKTFDLKLTIFKIENDNPRFIVETFEKSNK